MYGTCMHYYLTAEMSACWIVVHSRMKLFAAHRNLIAHAVQDWAAANGCRFTHLGTGPDALGRADVRWEHVLIEF